MASGPLEEDEMIKIKRAMLATALLQVSHDRLLVSDDKTALWLDGANLVVCKDGEEFVISPQCWQFAVPERTVSGGEKRRK